MNSFHKQPVVWCAFSLMILALLSGCSSGFNTDANSGTGQQELGPDHVLMALKFDVGKRYFFEFDMSFETNFGDELGAFMPKGQQAKQLQHFEVDVVSETPEGGRNVEFRFLRHQFDMEMGGDSVAIDTDLMDDETTVNPLFAGLLESVGHTVKIELDAKHNVKSFSGIEELRDKVLANATPQVQSMAQGIFSEHYVDNVVVPRGLPPGPVKPGDSWPLNLTQDLGIIGYFIADQQFQFKKMEDHKGTQCAQIAFSGTIRGGTRNDEKGTTPFGGVMEITGGTTFGKNWFDPELGQFTDSSVEQTMTMKMEVPGIPAEALKDGGIQLEIRQHLSRRLLRIEEIDSSTDAEAAPDSEEPSQDSATQ